MQDSGIEWTTHTHNEWIGCTKVSAGCKHCYAETLMDGRFGRVRWGAGKPRMLTSEANRRKPFGWDREAAKTGERPRVFTNSLADVFDEEVSDEWRDTLFARIALTPHLDWLVLTKRAEEMRTHLGDVAARGRIATAAARLRGGECGDLTLDAVFFGPWPLPNVWLGVSVEDQAAADERIPPLLDTRAAVRFLSVEPMLGAVDLSPWLRRLDTNHVPKGPHGRLEPGQTRCSRECAYGGGWCGCGIDWVIVGGESGKDARPCDVAWIRSVVEQCKAAGVPCFVKQLGARPVETPAHRLRHLRGVEAARAVPYGQERAMLTPLPMGLRDPKGGDPEEWPSDLRVREFPPAHQPAAP